MFTPNESTTFGMLRALRQSSLAAKVRFVGFDASDKLVQGVRDGDIDGLIVQRPFEMGYQAVKTMVQHLRGQAVPPRIDTGSTLVSKDNLGHARDPGPRSPRSQDMAGELTGTVMRTTRLPPLCLAR